MFEEQFSPRAVNFKGLDAALREGLGEAYNGLMVSDSMIRVFLNEELTRATVEAIVAAHDPTELTPEQQAEVEAEQAIEVAREELSEKLDLAVFANESAAVQQLAAYVAWLELEIRQLREL